jgi:hypothetical protein
VVALAFACWVTLCIIQSVDVDVPMGMVEIQSVSLSCLIYIAYVFGAGGAVAAAALTVSLCSDTLPIEITLQCANTICMCTPQALYIARLGCASPELSVRCGHS